MKQIWMASLSCICLAIVVAQSPRVSAAKDTNQRTATTNASEEENRTRELRRQPAPQPKANRPLTKIDVPALATPPAKSALAKIIKTRNLRVCVRSDVPPFGYFASQGLIGFDVDLAKMLGVRLSIYYKQHIRVSWQVIEAGERIKKLQTKSCDLVAAAFSYTPARASKVSFSKIYLETNKVALVANTITRALPVVALVRGTTNIAKGLKGTPRYFGNYKEIIDAMKNGEVDYVVADRPMGLHMIRSVTKTFRIYKSFKQKERYGLGVHRDHRELLKVINQGLRDLAKSGQLAYLYRQWL